MNQDDQTQRLLLVGAGCGCTLSLGIAGVMATYLMLAPQPAPPAMQNVSLPPAQPVALATAAPTPPPPSVAPTPRPRFEVGRGSLPPFEDRSIATVKIVEFGDFGCNYCARVQPTLKRLREDYGVQVAWYFRDFPLPTAHPDAPKAHEAARCAEEQGQFWAYHDLLYTHHDDLRRNRLLADALTLDLDLDRFTECLDSGRMAEAVALDKQAGVDAGVTGVPAAYINGWELRGAQPYEVWKALIDQELAR